MKDDLSNHLKTLAFLFMIGRMSEVQAGDVVPLVGSKFHYDKEEGVLIVDQTALEHLREIITDDEGNKLKPYRDSRGYLSIGVGRNLDVNGISEGEAIILRDNDIARVLLEAQQSFKWFDKLCPARQVVVLSMIFNLGIGGFKEFKKMISSLEKGDYNNACREMLDSLWAKQVGKRSKDLSVLMKLGRF